jgi:hypothetical protein
VRAGALHDHRAAAHDHGKDHGATGNIMATVVTVMVAISGRERLLHVVTGVAVMGRACRANCTSNVSTLSELLRKAVAGGANEAGAEQVG